MSDEFIPPVPGSGEPDEVPPLDFSAFTVENTGPITPEMFEVPNPKASRKRRWWEAKEKVSPDKRGPRKANPPKSILPTPKGGLKAALENLYCGLGMAMLPFDPHCAKIIIDNAEKCAESLDELAKTNPAFRNFLVRLVTTSAIGAAISVHAPIIAAISIHHIPALRKKQEKMVSEMAEMFANMPNFGMPNEGMGPVAE